MPLTRRPISSESLEQQGFVSLQERMSRDLSTFGAQQRRDDDADTLGSMLTLPDPSSISGETGYEGLLGATNDAADDGMALPDTQEAEQAPQRRRMMAAPTVAMPDIDITQSEPVYDPTDTGEIEGAPLYDPTAEDERLTPPAFGGTPAVMPQGAPSPTGTRVPQQGASLPKGEIDNSSRQSFVRTSYPYALEAADGDPQLAQQLIATAISENGKVGTGRSLGEMGFNVGGIQGVKGPAGSFTALDAGRPREFAAYNNLSEGFRAVRDLVSGGRYAGAAETYRQTGDIDRYWREINEKGYSETPGWENKIADIRRNQVAPLTQGLATQPKPGAVQAEQTPGAQAQALQGITPPQFGLGDADAESICGPVLAMAFARSNGRNPTIAEAKQMAAQNGGWTTAQGMGGPEAMAQTLRSMGIPATYKAGALDLETIRRETQNGNPVGINTRGHYFVVEGVDAQGRLDLGNSAKALRASGGRQWFRPDEIAGLGMGAPTGAIYKDSPSSPQPSVAVRETRMPAATLAAPDDPTARREADALSLKAIIEPLPSMVAAPTAPSGAVPTPLGATASSGAEPMPTAPDMPGEGRVRGYPQVDIRAPGEQPYDVTDAEGTDRTNDPLFPRPLPAQRMPGLRLPVDEMQRQPLGQALPDMASTDFDPRDADSGPREDPNAIKYPSNNGQIDESGPRESGYVLPPAPLAGDDPGTQTTELAPRGMPTDPPVYGPPLQSTAPIQPAIPAVENARAGLEADRDLAPASVLETVTAPARRVYEQTIEEARADEDKFFTENAPTIAQFSRESGVPLEQVHRGLRIARDVVLATPQATADSINAVLEQIGLGRSSIGVNVPAFGQVGIADFVDLPGPMAGLTSLGVARGSVTSAANTAATRAAQRIPDVAGAIERGAGAAVNAAGEAVQGVARRGGELLEQGRATARRAEQLPGTALPGTLGISPDEQSMRGLTRTRVVPPDVADTLDFPVRIPDDPATVRAIESIGGTVDPERGVTLNVTRAQGESAAGGVATRGGVFYEAVPEGGRSSFVTGADNPNAVGGTQVIPPTPTRFRSPLILSDAPGDGGFDQGIERLGVGRSLTADELAGYDRLVQDAERRLADVRARKPGEPGAGGAWLENAEKDVIDARAQRERAPSQTRRFTAADIDAAVRQARAAGPEGSPARAQALKDVVARYGGDPNLIDDLMAIRGADASESAWAIKENILAANARKQGYDGVVTVQTSTDAKAHQAAVQAAVEAHPRYQAQKAELDRTAAEMARTESDYGEAIDRYGYDSPQAQAIRDQQDAATRAYEAAQDTLDKIQRSLANTVKVDPPRRITELMDPREARNPTPGASREVSLADTATQLDEARKEWRRLAAEMQAGKGDPAALDQAMARVAALEQDYDTVLRTGSQTVHEPSGYTLREDIPRRSEGGTTASASAGALPSTPGSGILPTVNRAASEAIVGGTGGAVIEQARNPDEDPRTAAARGFAVGAVGFPAATRAARGVARRAGADVRTQGAMATFGAAPAPDAPNRAIAVGSDPSKRYEFRYRVADLSDLIPSNLPNGAPNPDFPRVLQPRSRERVASQLQIDQIAQGLEPDALLNDVGRLDSGPMIVGADNIVESGNGRTLALQRAAQNYPEQYQRYVEDLRGRLDEYGLSPDDIEGVKTPVLVRERVSEVDRAAFSAEANNSGILRMSSVEQAAQDAGNLSDDVVANLSVSENDTIASALRKTENRDLVRQWVGTLPENERAGVLDADGNLSAQGYERLTNAMLMQTYGQGAGERIARAFIESADPTVRSVQNALMQSLPDMARSEALIRAGHRDAGLSIADDVGAAVDMLARLKREGVKVSDYLGQDAMFERELTPLQESILDFLDRGQRKPSTIRDALKEYAQRVENTADPNQVDMFGGQVATPSREDLWRGTIAGADIPEPPLIAAATEANQAAGRTAADGAELAGAGPESVARPLDIPPAPERPASPRVTQPRPGPVPDDILPATGGPEGALRREGAPSDLGMVPGAREGPPAPVAPRGTPVEGYDPAASRQLIPDEQMVRSFQERIRDPEKAERAATEYQRMIAEGASPEARATFLRNAEDSLWWDRLDTLRYASMLSDPVTHGQNAIGSIELGIVDALERPLTALLDKGRARVTGGAREAFMSESSAQVIGMAGAARQALSDAGFIMAHGLRPEDLAKLDRRTRGFATDIPGVAPKGSRAAGVIDAAMEGPLRALSAADALFRGIFRGGHLAAEAERAARVANNGNPVTAEQAAKAMLDPEVAKRAEQRAAQAVLQEDRAITTAINSMRSRLPQGAQAALSVVVPYIKTPYNIVAQGVGMTPAGVVSLIDDIRKGAPMAERERRVSRMLIGGAVMAWAGYENLQGLNTGAYPEKESERSTLPPGWRPFSRKVEIGGETYYVPLAALGPLGIPAAVSILVTEQVKNGKPFSTEQAAAVAEGMGKFAEDQTFLRSISDASEALGKGGTTLQNYIERQASQFSPHVIGGGGVGRRTQAIRGEPSRDPEGPVEAWLATLPYGDAVSDMLGIDPAPVRRDVLGRPSVSNPDGAAALVPIRASVEHDAAVIRAYRKAGEGLPTRAPERVRDPETDETRTLSRRQKDRWRVEFGRALREEWSDQGSPTDAATLRKAEAAARKRATTAVLSR